MLSSFATPADEHFFHVAFLLHDGTLPPGEAGKDLQFNVVLLGHLHRAVVEHLGAQGRQLQHLVIGDGAELDGPGDFPGVGGVDAVHVGENLAQIRVHGGGNGHGAGV